MKNEFILVVDDTGFNANQKRANMLKSEKSCFCGVLILKQNIDYVLHLLNHLSDRLFREFGEREFHFTDIYNRKGAFKNIKIDETIDIIETFVNLFNHLDVPIIVSTINNQSTKNSNHIFILEYIKNNILKNMGLPKDDKSANFILNIIRSKQQMEDIYEDAFLTDVISDEGLLNAGRKITLPTKDNTINISFEESKNNPLLQLVDFAAWALTRTKHIMDKPKSSIKEWDKQLLQIISKMPYCNISQVLYPLDSHKEFDYDNAKPINE